MPTNYILEHLAIGNPADAQQAVEFFDAFLNVAAEVGFDASHFEGRPYHKVPIEDMKSIPSFQLQEAVEFIEKNIRTKRLLVFCDGGVGRAPSVVVAYLCSKGMRFGQAVEFVAMRKPYMSILPELIDSVRKAFSRPPPPILHVEPFELPCKPAEPVPAS